MGRAIVILVLLGLLVLFCVKRWQYRECRQVGHGALYCTMKAIQ